MKIGIYSQLLKPQDSEVLFPFFEELKSRNIKISVHEATLSQLKTVLNYQNEEFSVFKQNKDLPTDTDLIFAFGGDGTILSAATIVKDSNIPIVGVNTGRLGFLASLQKNEFIKELPEILNKNYTLSERTLLTVKTKKNITFPFALNELAISRKETTSMITIDSYVDGEFLNTFWADGLIVSTPTGSTGYSLSCGGPIITPETGNFVITPIAPHNLNVRPLLINDCSELRLKVFSRGVSEYSLSLDSRLVSLPVEDEVILKKADFKIKIVHHNGYSFFNTLRQKLNWGTDSRN